MSGSWDETREAYEARMRADGFTIVYPKDNELQIDIDTWDQHQQFLTQFEVLKRNLGEELASRVQVVVRPSSSGAPNRWHVTVTLPFGVNHWQRIAWQAALGSDPLRELLSCFRAWRGDTTPGIFVEKQVYPGA